MKKSRKLFAIFGDPVSHSISPLMHNYAFNGLRIDACYTRYRLVESQMLREKFLSLGLKGINITVPHKEAAFQACDKVEGIAKEIEAVNTIVYRNEKLIGYNTDAPGFLESAFGFGKIASVCIIGAGGTARAIAAAFKERGVSVTLLNRSEGRLAYFKERGFNVYSWQTWETGSFDLVVNTTSAGLTQNDLPAPEAILRPLLQNAKYAIDVIYNKETPFLSLAKSIGIPVKDGSEMLLFQGVLAFEHFTDHNYPKERIKTLMQKAFD
jgi:shikimate dehydrogenase